jgi:hypothetical protein
VVTEKGILFFADLNGAASILFHHQLVSVWFYFAAVRPPAPSYAVLHARTHLRNQNLITSSNTHSYPLAILVQSAGSHGQNLGLVQLLDGGLGQEDAAGGLRLGFDALDQDAVEERCEGADGFQCCGLLGVVSM